jgi:hypothetical protein
MGRNGHDVFVLGDEALVAEPDSTQDSGSVWVDEARHRGMDSMEGHEAVASVGVRHRASSVPRRLAVLGLSVGAVVVFAASRLLTGGGDSPSRPSLRSSSVVSPAPLPTPVSKHVVAPSPSPRHRVHRSPKPTRRHGFRRRRSPRDIGVQRETTTHEAQSRPVAVVPTTPSAPVPPPAPSPAPAPFTSPPVRSSLSSAKGGSGSGGGQEFGFER